MPVRRVVIGGVVALVAAGVFWRVMQPSAAPVAKPANTPVLVSIAPAQPRAFHDRLDALGTLRAREAVDITAPVAEIVDQIHFREGQPVREGEVLVTLRQTEEQAELADARANLAEQQRELTRLEGLLKQRAAPGNEVDSRRTLLERARQQVAMAEARLADRTLRAPFAGVVGFRHVSPGAMVSPGDVITTLDDVGLLKLEFSVPSDRLPMLQQAERVEARAPGLTDPFLGKVTLVNSRVNPDDRSVRARAELSNPEGRLKPGMLVQVSVLSPARESVAVPEGAVLSQQDRHFVYVVDAEQRAQRREVRLGVRDNGQVEVLEGLAAGEPLIVEGLMALSPGKRVSAAAGQAKAG